MLINYQNFVYSICKICKKLRQKCKTYSKSNAIGTNRILSKLNFPDKIKVSKIYVYIMATGSLQKVIIKKIKITKQLLRQMRYYLALRTHEMAAELVSKILKPDVPLSWMDFHSFQASFFYFLLLYYVTVFFILTFCRKYPVEVPVGSDKVVFCQMFFLFVSVFVIYNSYVKHFFPLKFV